MASVFKQAGKGDCWYAAWKDHNGKWQRKSTFTTDMAAAKRIASKYETDAALRRDGVINPSDDRLSAQAKRPIANHLDEFKASLEAKGNTDGHCQETYGKAKRIAEICSAEVVSDLTPFAVQAALRTLRDGTKDTPGVALKTCNHYLRAIKSFTRWLHRDKRTRDDALVTLQAFNAETDRRHERRELSDEELTWLIQTTADRTRPETALTGEDRAMLYRLAAGTGFRAKELRSLTPESFSLDGDSPTVTINAAHSKHRRTDVQPIRHDLAELLKAWLADKPARKRVFQKMPLKPARMLRPDLQAARAAWIEAPSDKAEREKREKSEFLLYRNAAGEVFDFHSFRHGYISAIVAGGASVKSAQELARHSTPTLTIGRYSHTRLSDLRGALDALPKVGLDALNPIGINAKRLNPRDKDRDKAARVFAQNGATPCDIVRDSRISGTSHKALRRNEKSDALQHCATPRQEYPLPDLNRCYRTENPGS